MAIEQKDIVVIGAGVSGVDAAYRIQEKLPGMSYTVVESRANLGGTWDLFKYPGIRSDSDMYSFGFPFRPWKGGQTLTGGANIVKYLKETISENGIDKHIQYNSRVESVHWSSTDAKWTLQIQGESGARQIEARFLYFSTGYYDYDRPLEVNIPGLKNFKGQTLHPQFWPEKLDYAGKKVVVIGSGATAITLLPAMAETAAKVTMLQRSPTYIIPVPQKAPYPQWLAKVVPENLLFHTIRLQFVIVHLFFYNFCKTMPGVARWLFSRGTRSLLPKTVPVDPHFRPRYNPWDQRVCAAPDGDFFSCLHRGVADVKTGIIKTVSEDGILLNSGEKLDADIIITATGLKMRFAGGIKIVVDGEQVDTGKRFFWKGSMMQGVPNTAFAIGYANASWTLGADVTALGFARLINHLNASGLKYAVPRVPEEDADMQEKPLLDLSSTYVQAAAAILPRTGNKAPWTPRTNYFTDWWLATRTSLTQGLELA